MPRARWWVVAVLVLAVGSALNERGPFAANEALAYDTFLTDFQAGKVERIVQWRDRLEVTEEGGLFAVVVPPSRDLPLDLAQARLAGGVGISYSRLPDAWLGVMTPWGPLLLAAATALIWTWAVARRRVSALGRGVTPGVEPAG